MSEFMELPPLPLRCGSSTCTCNESWVTEDKQEVLVYCLFNKSGSKLDLSLPPLRWSSLGPISQDTYFRAVMGTREERARYSQYRSEQLKWH